MRNKIHTSYERAREAKSFITRRLLTFTRRLNPGYACGINLHCKGTAYINVNHIRSVFASKICNYFVKSLLD